MVSGGGALVDHEKSLRCLGTMVLLLRIGLEKSRYSQGRAPQGRRYYAELNLKAVTVVKKKKKKNRDAWQ